MIPASCVPWRSSSRAVVGIGRGAHLGIAAHDIQPRLDVTAQILVQAIDAGVEQGDRHAAAVVGRKRHLGAVAPEPAPRGLPSDLTSSEVG